MSYKVFFTLAAAVDKHLADLLDAAMRDRAFLHARTLGLTYDDAHEIVDTYRHLGRTWTQIEQTITTTAMNDALTGSNAWRHE